MPMPAPCLIHHHRGPIHRVPRTCSRLGSSVEVGTSAGAIYKSHHGPQHPKSPGQQQWSYRSSRYVSRRPPCNPSEPSHHSLPLCGQILCSSPESAPSHHSTRILQLFDLAGIGIGSSGIGRSWNSPIHFEMRGEWI